MKTPIHTIETDSDQKLAKNRGGALITVLILGAAILLLVGSYLSSLVTQQRISHRAMIHNEARNVAEGVAAVAVGEIHRNVASRSNIFSSPILDGFSLEAEDIEALAPAGSNVLAASLAFQEGPVSVRPTNRVILLNNDPVNFNDPEAGRFVSVRTKNLFSRATVRDPLSGSEVTSHTAHHLRFTQGAWFDYAIFFNMDLEFHAGTNMTAGSTHSNGDIYLTSGGGNTLTFNEPLTTSSRVYRFLKYTRGNFDAARGVFTTTGRTYPNGNTSNHIGPVQCTNYPAGQPPAMLAMTNREFLGAGTPATNDSTRTGTQSFAGANIWNGGVMDGTMGVLPFNPPGMQPYTPEDFTTADVELRNNAYVMIEPQLADRDLTCDYSGGQMNGHKGDVVENLKFSGKAGLTIQVMPPAAAGQQPQWRLVWYRTMNPSLPISEGNPVMRDGNGQPIILGRLNPFTEVDESDISATGVRPGTPTIQRALRLALLKAIISVPYEDDGGGTGDFGTGGAGTTIQEFDPIAGATQAIRVVNTHNASNNLNGFNADLQSDGSREDPRYYPIYDRREGIPVGNPLPAQDLRGAFHTLIIDMVALHRVLNDRPLWRAVDSDGLALTTYRFDPNTQFNGVLYVQFPLPATSDATRAGLPNSDNIRVAIRPTSTSPGYALLLRNGGGSRAQNSGTGFLPQGPWDTSAQPEGFTVATNGPAYIWGHYNSNGVSVNAATNMTTPDGDWQTNHLIVPGDLTSGRYPGVELPALIAADAVTILSANANYVAGNNFALMTQPVANRPNAAPFTEMATAIMGGLVPTRPLSTLMIWAGGVHNFIRYLENWGGQTLGYRGSIVALYENEVVLGPMFENRLAFWYNPPTREIGYHAFFDVGRYPPGTPIVNSMRTINVRDITEAEWTAGPQQPPAYAPAP